MKKSVYVYCNTHWDFEWYFSQFESTMLLVYHMDEVMNHLEKGTIDYYLLDGQVAIIEDYLRYEPSKKERFMKLVNAGKIQIGPWYTQTDELIISGESILRNLIYGLKVARTFTKTPVLIGYLPDSFGQSQDLPKMLNSVGIGQAVFWRGMSAIDTCAVREFVWESKDGSEVLAYNIRNGYGCDMMVSDDVSDLETKYLSGCEMPIALLPMGGDQRPIDVKLKDRMKFYEENSPSESTYKEGNMVDFMKELEIYRDKLPHIRGEFITASASKIHRSIYSSRADHKYLQDKVERRLIYQLEPLMVLANAMGLSTKTDSLEEIWKTLMRNHAHDSAGGCNSDKTNTIILNRLTEVDQLSYSMIDYIVRKLGISQDDSKLNNLYLFNSLPYKRVVRQKILIATLKPSFIINSVDGKPMEFDIIKQDKTNYGLLVRDKSKIDSSRYYYNSTIVLKATLEPLSMQKFVVQEQDIPPLILFNKTTNIIEDSYFKIIFTNGQINLTNKHTNEIIENWFSLEDGGDEGDTYDYSPAYKDKIFNLVFKDSTVTNKQGKVIQILIISGIFHLPADLVERASGITSSQTTYIIELKLADNGLVEVKTEIDNYTKDHRLRAFFKTGVESKQSIANTQFSLVKRDNCPKHMDDWRDIPWREEPTPIYPALSFVALENGDKSCIALLKGIKEYEIIEDKTIALTLFRSVGFLGRPDLIRRPGMASGQECNSVPTPQSQLQGKIKGKFAFSFNQKVSYSSTLKLWQDYAISVYSYQDQKLNRYTNALQYFSILPLNNSISAISNLVDASYINMVFVSSIRPIAEKMFIIHLVADDTKDIGDAGYLVVRGLKSAQWCLVTGEKLADLSINNNKLDLGSFKASQLKALEITLT